jgi:hypothetical protein
LTILNGKTQQQNFTGLFKKPFTNTSLPKYPAAYKALNYTNTARTSFRRRTLL